MYEGENVDCALSVGVQIGAATIGNKKEVLLRLSNVKIPKAPLTLALPIFQIILYLEAKKFWENPKSLMSFFILKIFTEFPLLLEIKKNLKY